MPSKTYNTRAPDMWEIVKKHVDFKGKSVVDYGFGWGDMMFYAYEAGAQHPVRGVSIDRHGVLFFVQDRIPREKPITGAFHVELKSIEEVMRWETKYNNEHYSSDIAICFSVLPYLKEPFAFLKYLRENHQTTLIECQYAGDGPGFSWANGDHDMANWLMMVGWDSVDAIGKTYVEDRDKWRTIWKCER